MGRVVCWLEYCDSENTGRLEDSPVRGTLSRVIENRVSGDFSWEG